MLAKVASSHTVRSSRGGLSTLLTALFILFLTYVEVGHFFGGEIDHFFKVDKSIGKTLMINVDLVVAMPCNFIHTNVRDITHDRFLASEILKYEGFTFFIPETYRVNDNNEIKTPDLDEILAEGIVAEFRDRGDQKDSGAPACHIYGNIPVNKVTGTFQITANGWGYRSNNRAHVDVSSLNFTHLISEFSFGEFYPYINNPLDQTVRTTETNLQSFKYYVTVVPTIYKKLGVEIDTNQYSVSNQDVTFNEKKRGVPGIFFQYDFEPITLVVEDDRIPFITFLVRLATIYGGIIISAKWIYKIFDKVLILLFGKKFASRGDEKTTTLLDEDEKE